MCSLTVVSQRFNFFLTSLNIMRTISPKNHEMLVAIFLKASVLSRVFPRLPWQGSLADAVSSSFHQWEIDMDSAMTTSLAPSHVSARENSAPHGVECRILGVWVRGKSTSPRSHKGVVFSHQVIGSWAPLTSMDRTPSCDSWSISLDFGGGFAGVHSPWQAQRCRPGGW